MGEQEQIQIYVATHKPIAFDLPDICAIMQVNTAKVDPWPNVLHDADGENIAEKNANYSELTALYALWKNCDADIKGLMHYRRYLGKSAALPLYHVDIVSARALRNAIIDREDILSALSDHDMIVPIPEGPFPRNVFEDLLRFCYLRDILHMADVIEEDYPDYRDAFWTIMRADHVSYCNMLIAKKDIFDDYCAWLFAVLEKIETRCDLTGYDAQHARLYGYLSEVLMDVYTLQNNCRCDYRQILMPVDGTSAALRLRSELKRARNRFHDALRLAPFSTYHLARYRVNLARLAAQNEANDRPSTMQAASREQAHEQVCALMKRLGAKKIKSIPIGRAGRRTGVLAYFRESIFLHVILKTGDLANQGAMDALLPALEKRRVALENKHGITTLIRLVAPEDTDPDRILAFSRRGIRLISYGELNATLQDVFVSFLSV